MKKFQVRIEGANLYFDRDGRLERMGFITTRFVEADSIHDAEERAVQLVRDDVSTFVANPTEDPPRIFACEEAFELEAYPEGIVPPHKGYSFFPDEETQH
jgi:hypothetical protein